MTGSVPVIVEKSSMSLMIRSNALRGFLCWMKSSAITSGGSIEPPDVIAENFIQQRNPRRALDRIMRDILLFSMITGTEPVIADIDENHYEE